MKFVIPLITSVIISSIAHGAPTTEQISKLLLPKLDKASGVTHRHKNERLDGELNFKILKNKPGYGIALLQLNQAAPENDDKFSIEVYLLKLEPTPSIAAKGVFTQDTFCECGDGGSRNSYDISDTTVPLGEKDEAFIINMSENTGGSGGTWGDIQSIGALALKDGNKFEHILNFTTEVNSEVSGSHEGEDDYFYAARSTSTSYKFLPSKKAWIFEGTDEDFLFGQSIKIQKKFAWNPKSRKLSEITGNHYLEERCTAKHVETANTFAKKYAKSKKPNIAAGILENVTKTCGSYPTFEKLSWIESDMLLYFLKAKNYDSCMQKAEDLIKRADFSTRPKEVQSAILHNKKLCEEKNKTPAL